MKYILPKSYIAVDGISPHSEVTPSPMHSCLDACDPVSYLPSHPLLYVTKRSLLLSWHYISVFIWQTWPLPALLVRRAGTMLYLGLLRDMLEQAMVNVLLNCRACPVQSQQAQQYDD